MVAGRANVLVYGDDGLDDDTAYHYRVRATNGAGGSGYSNVASATTRGPQTTRAAPATRTWRVRRRPSLRLRRRPA